MAIRKIGFLTLLAFACTEAFSTPTTVKASATTALGATQSMVDSRRAILKRAGAFAAAVAFTPTANALDMDAFANAQIEADVKNCDPKRDPKCIPKLNADEALCKYGQSGKAKGEACKRVKAAGGDISQPAQGKSLGGAYAM